MPVPNPRPATLFGTGKVEELAGLVRAEEAELVIVDHPLTPVQQRNLETAWDAKVLDRTGLILEIFGSARGRGKGASKSSSPISSIRRAGWSGRGRISSASAVASASSAAPAKRRSRPTGG